MERVTTSPEQTQQLAKDLAPHLPDGAILCFFGELGAGKTTFIRGLVSGCGADPEQVSSPTYTYLNIYAGERTVRHFDLYRLRDVDEFLGMGFEEFLEGDGITCIEWSERIELLTKGLDVLKVIMEHMDNGSRKVLLSGPCLEGSCMDEQ
jgi:tRNA threonylcarbamoyladenosine biosynthesis protein TsaE